MPRRRAAAPLLHAPKPSVCAPSRRRRRGRRVAWWRTLAARSAESVCLIFCVIYEGTDPWRGTDPWPGKGTATLHAALVLWTSGPLSVRSWDGSVLCVCVCGRCKCVAVRDCRHPGAATASDRRVRASSDELRWRCAALDASEEVVARDVTRLGTAYLCDAPRDRRCTIHDACVC